MIPAVASIAYPSIDPVIVRLGPLAVRWYGVAYLAAFALGYFGLRRLVQRGRLRLSLDQLSDLLGWLVVGVLVGGRAGWWLFYHRGGGAAEPWYEPLAIWHGGMSFHGGLLGVSAVTIAWTRVNRSSLMNVADGVAFVAPLGLFFGRIANFINAELVGRPTSLPWGVAFPGDALTRHPSQLYEALLEGPLLFLALHFAKVRARRDGEIAALFLTLYGVARFSVEFAREPDPQLGFIAFGWLTMGQLLSVALFVAGLAFRLTIHKVKWNQASLATAS